VARVAGRSFSKAEVAEAAWRVILRNGLSKATVRAIAAELGATTGAVTYHFPGQAELLLFALDRLGDAILAQIDASLREAAGLDRIRRILEATLPLGPAQITGWRLWLAFVGAALTNPRLREEHRRRLDVLTQLYVTELKGLRRAGLIRPDLDPGAEADALVALSDGLGLSHLLRPARYTAAVQRAIVERYLGDRFAPARRRAGRSAGR
jgi:AcrR family transcriptional regulator